MAKVVELTATITCDSLAEYLALDAKPLEEIGLWVESKASDEGNLRIAYTGSQTLPW